MQKSLTIVLQLLAAGMMLLGDAPAQTPAATTKPAAPAKTAQGTAAKKTTTVAKPPAVLLKTQKEKASYALGMNIGMNFKRQEVPVDPALVARGLKDAMTGAKPLITPQEGQAALTELKSQVDQKMKEQQQAMQVEQQEMLAKAHEAGLGNRKEGDAFLAENKTKEGVVTLPSGLQYKILKEGTGPKPTANDTVSCNYRGARINGKEFDSSEKEGGPVSFQVGGVIKGWTEALQLMPVGSKWELFIPADLAYGDTPRPGGDIAPGDTLVFDVELVSIADQKKQDVSH